MTSPDKRSDEYRDLAALVESATVRARAAVEQRLAPGCAAAVAVEPDDLLRRHVTNTLSAELGAEVDLVIAAIPELPDFSPAAAPILVYLGVGHPVPPFLELMTALARRWPDSSFIIRQPRAAARFVEHWYWTVPHAQVLDDVQVAPLLEGLVRAAVIRRDSLRIALERAEVARQLNDQLGTSATLAAGYCPPPERHVRTLHEAEAAEVALALATFNGNVAAAARALGVTRQALYRLLAKHRSVRKDGVSDIGHRSLPK